MKIAMCILIAMYSAGAFGQKYHKCLVYQYHPPDTKGQLVGRQFFNNGGKVYKEVYSHYNYYWPDGSTREAKEDGKYEYFYESDMLLKRCKRPNGSDELGEYQEFYEYNGKQQLIKEYSGFGPMDSAPSDYSSYFYDTTGRINKKVTYRNLGGIVRDFFLYGPDNVLSEDSCVSNCSDGIVVKYRYAKYSVILFTYDMDCNCHTFKRVLKLDSAGRTLEEAIYFPENRYKK
jgi:hypothetical protein